MTRYEPALTVIVIYVHGSGAVNGVLSQKVIPPRPQTLGMSTAHWDALAQRHFGEVIFADADDDGVLLPQTVAGRDLDRANPNREP